MEKGYMKFLVPTMLAMTLMANADDGEIAQSDCQVPVKVEPCEPSYYEYHNRISVFGPLHQTYERIKTDDLYVGVETWLLHTLSTDHGVDDSLIGEAEVRFGYNYFYNGRDHITPFVGVGVIKDYGKEHWSEHNRAIKPAVVYGVFGLLYDHEFNTIFNLGLNFKGLIGGPVSSKHHDWGSPVGGIDVAIPVTFRFGHHRHWDIRLEPFDIYLRGSHISRNYFGGRSTIGYRF